MANATAEMPSKEKGTKEKTRWAKEEAFLAQEFEPGLKYMFELAEKNLKRELPVIDMHTKRPAPEKPFIPYRNIVFYSQIIWKGQRESIRYYDGCDTIFVKDQPKDKEIIEQYRAQTTRRQFIDGKFGCFGDERMLLLFMLAASFNGKSEFRTRTADVVYILSDSAAIATSESAKLDMIEQALELARNATVTKMMIHGDFLGIPLTDFDSGNELSEKEIRTAYRLRASSDAKAFVDSYGNKALEVKYYIKKALLQGLISNEADPNWMLWKTSGRRICDSSGIKSFDGKCDRLFEFSQLEEGEEFKVQLTALFNNS